MEMEQTRDESGPSEQRPSSNTWWPSDFIEKLGSVSLDSMEESLSHKGSLGNNVDDRFSSRTASQILWSTGMLAETIPNGFYSVIPEKGLKDHFDEIPTLDELHALELEGLRADIILVDAQKDKKFSMLKQLIVALVKGLNSNPATVIKKIAGLVSDFYKRPNLDLSPTKTALEETSHISDNRGVQLLGRIKNGSCRPRAILFKALADTVGLKSRLVVGLPDEGAVECIDLYKHMSVIVVLNSIELLVDLMRFPGQLIPRSTKAIFMTHISGAGESDSAENDSCDSPLEPNSPLYGFSERVDNESSEKDDSLQFQRRLEVSLNVAGPSLRNKMLRSSSSIGNLSISHSEPDIATTFWRRSRRKVIAEPRTASSSPEHPSLRGRGRSMLSGDRRSFKEYGDDNGTSSHRSEGASTSETRRIRRRSISITPEIGDDIVRAVRAMNETLKQNRLLRDHSDNRLYPDLSDDRSSGPGLQKDIFLIDIVPARVGVEKVRPQSGWITHVVHDRIQNVQGLLQLLESVLDLHVDDRDGISGGRSLYSLPRERLASQKAMSLPSSPHQFRSQTCDRGGTSDYIVNDDMLLTWNKILKSPMFQNKPLLPFQEWNIDFSEVTVGTRVGIGSFGEVFRGIWNGTDVAIKVFLEQDLTAENMEDFCNEISILSRLRHPNVILFLGACTKPPRLSMITEYMEMGSIYYLIHGQKKKLSWRRRLKMLRDICRGLMCIHRMKVVHRDIKSANCLVNKHWTVKICDFGLSRTMTDEPMIDSLSAGTAEWMAPELMRKEPFTEKCDIFSLGVIMWELCSLNRPWEGVPTEQVASTVGYQGARLEIPDGPLGRLIADCWAEPDERPSCELILTRLVECEYSLC